MVERVRGIVVIIMIVVMRGIAVWRVVVSEATVVVPVFMEVVVRVVSIGISGVVVSIWMAAVLSVGMWIVSIIPVWMIVMEVVVSFSVPVGMVWMIVMIVTSSWMSYWTWMWNTIWCWGAYISSVGEWAAVWVWVSSAWVWNCARSGTVVTGIGVVSSAWVWS